MFEKYMSLAINEAKKADIDVPIGAVIVKDNRVISSGFNQVIIKNKSTLHAEIIAINEACEALHSHNLSGCDIYVTLEPCVMCMGAIINSKISRLIYGAYDFNKGSYNSINKINVPDKLEIYGGILEEECSIIIKDFFKDLRNKKANN